MRPNYYGFNFVGSLAIGGALVLLGGPLLAAIVLLTYLAAVLVCD